ncbi:transcription antitermination factor NusB [Galbitalea sp. SE-J8]|uniref:transcription antitermination factor NusB n=1 Tax=Galbitalea sp. SE-J8 TaxID=3054952 RepID=UPI00259C9785|nr:transcription antitermination factor NusB [Galbitalea sp. SE-J8]MDM4763258.1 transcription antitermination factor NusB [Galbitalea sp. SE-J8]
MSARSKARKRALDLLYGADLRGLALDDAIATEAARALANPQRASSWGYARDIAQGVADHIDEIDTLISTYAQGWTIQRMPAVDRALLRMGIWEIVFNPEVPDPVAIAEAVGLATELSTEESSGFVNGLLARIAETKAQ